MGAGCYLAVDYGRRRIGVAVSDPLGLTARPLETIDLAAGVGGRPGPDWRASPGALRRAAERLVALCREHEARGVVVGEPRDLGGDAAAGASWIAARVAELRAALDEASLVAVPIHRVDERGSTQAALAGAAGSRTSERDLRESGRLDAMAAAVILRQFLAELPPRPVEAPEPLPHRED